MSTGTIYVIARQLRHNSYDGPHVIEVDINYGYFVTRDAAEAFAADLDKGPMERYLAQVAAYEKAELAWEQKQARAAALGFANPDPTPFPGFEEPLPHVVVEAYPAANTKSE